MIITLFTDFGVHGTQVATLKALLVAAVPGASLFDVSHTIPPYDIQQAAYLLRGTWQYFDAPCIHLVAVDIFNSTAVVVFEKEGRMFVGPDNGVFSLAFEDIDGVRLGFAQMQHSTFSDWAGRVALLAATLAGEGIAHLPDHTLRQRVVAAKPTTTPLGIDCRIHHVDRFGNVVLDITRRQFEELLQGRPFTIKLTKGQEVTAISNHYGEVKEGIALCRFNRADYLELAVNRQSAAMLLGLESYNQAALKYRTVRIFI